MFGVARTAFLLLVFSLPFMEPAVTVGGLAATATDLLFLVAAAALAVAMARGEARLRWDPLYGVLLAYFAAMLLSAVLADEPRRAWIKLATQAYLLSLPLLAATLIRNPDDLVAAVRAWLAGAAVTALVGMLALLLFVLGIGGPLADFALHEFGSLPPGDYPRLEATFGFPAMLCNYLTVSLVLLLLACKLEWIGPPAFALLLAAMLVTALFTLTPGLGGIALALALWFFVVSRARAALAVGSVVAAAFLVAAAVTPFLQPTAPFLFGLGPVELAPSVRMMTWIDAARTFVAHPLLGAGIGADPAAVRYVAPSGSTHQLTDAHNVFLNLAAQCGLVGLSVLLWLIVHVARRTAPFKAEGPRLIRVALGLGWLNAFVYQGLTGSYEDARHLWLMLGMLVASAHTARAAVQRRPSGSTSEAAA